MANVPQLAPEGSGSPSQFIFHRIGPIFDPAYLKTLNPEMIKEITAIGIRAELSAAQAYAKALQEASQVLGK
jgi:hypothetical protein